MAHKELSAAELSTVSLALMGWVERCKAEAKCMDELAKDFDTPENDQCARNAAASRQFQADAEAVLAKLRSN